MRRFIETYKGYDIYIETNEEMTAGSPYYEIMDKDLGIRYWIYENLEAVKRIIDEITRDYILRVEGSHEQTEETQICKDCIEQKCIGYNQC